MARFFASANNEWLSHTATPVATQALTMAAWFNTNTDTTFGPIFTLERTPTANHFFRLAIRGDVAGDKLELAVDSGAGAQSAATSTSFTVNTWHHAIGISASATDHRSYLDNAGVGSATGSRVPSSVTRLLIGGWGNGGTVSGLFDGSIAEVGLWNIALSAGQRAILAAGYSPLFVAPANLKFYAL